MTSTKRTSPQKLNNSQGLEMLAQFNTQFADAVVDASRNYLESIRELQTELLGFAGNRLNANVETGRELMSSQDISEVVQIQAAWLRNVTDQYSAEAKRVLDLVSRLSSSAWSPAFPHVKTSTRTPETSATPTSTKKAGATAKPCKDDKAVPAAIAAAGQRKKRAASASGAEKH